MVVVWPISVTMSSPVNPQLWFEIQRKLNATRMSNMFAMLLILSMLQFRVAVRRGFYLHTSYLVMNILTRSVWPDTTAYCRKMPGIHFTKALYDHNWILRKLSLLLLIFQSSYYVTILHSCMCKNVLWSGDYLSILINIIFKRFQLWAHKGFMKWVPGIGKFDLGSNRTGCAWCRFYIFNNFTP